MAAYHARTPPPILRATYLIGASDKRRCGHVLRAHVIHAGRSSITQSSFRSARHQLQARMQRQRFKAASHLQVLTPLRCAVNILLLQVTPSQLHFQADVKTHSRLEFPKGAGCFHKFLGHVPCIPCVPYQDLHPNGPPEKYWVGCDSATKLHCESLAPGQSSYHAADAILFYPLSGRFEWLQNAPRQGFQAGQPVGAYTEQKVKLQHPRRSLKSIGLLPLRFSIYSS